MSRLHQSAIRTIALAAAAGHTGDLPARLAVDLARHFSADLVGLLLEDDALLRAAALPLAMEVCRSGDERPFDPLRLERSLAGAARRLHAALSVDGHAAVQVLRLRGTPRRALADAVADVLVFAARRSRWSAATTHPLLLSTAGGNPARLDAVATALAPHTAPWPWEHLPWSNDPALPGRVLRRRPSLVLAAIDASTDAESACSLIDALDCPVIVLR